MSKLELTARKRMIYINIYGTCTAGGHTIDPSTKLLCVIKHCTLYSVHIIYPFFNYGNEKAKTPSLSLYAVKAKEQKRQSSLPLGLHC
jgi:hypothetical protein